MTENPGITFAAERDAVVESKPMPEPGEGEVLIETEQTLVSTGTELMWLTDSHVSRDDIFPFEPGYNNVGTIVEAGPGVDDDAVGERVATYGGHQRYTVNSYDGCYAVPAALETEEAVYFTIGEIVMNGVRRSELAFGEGAAVFGLGLLGQLAVRCAHVAGGHPVVGLDIASNRLEFLPAASDVHAVNPDDDGWTDEVEAVTGGELADVVFEVTGIPDVIPDEFDILAEEGRFVVLGSPRGSTDFDFNRKCHHPGYTIIGAHNRTHAGTPTRHNRWTRPRHVELFFDLLEAGRLSTAELTTHRESYADAPSVYDMLLEDRTQALGVILEWD